VGRVRVCGGAGRRKINDCIAWSEGGKRQGVGFDGAEGESCEVDVG